MNGHRDKEAFLLDFADALHSVAVPVPEIEDRVRRVGKALGLEADAFLLQSVGVLNTGRLTFRRMDFEYHWNLRRLLELRALTDRLAGGALDLDRGQNELKRIMSQPWRFPRWEVVLGYGIYGAAVTARIGGGWVEIAVAVLVGLVAGLIHLGAVINRPVDLLKSFIAALAGGLVAMALARVLPPFDFARSLFGGVCLLVPAMLLTIGTFEVANDGLEPGIFRLVYGALRFVLIALGLAVAHQIWRPFGGLPDARATPLPWPVVTALVAAGGAVLTVCLQARRRDLPWVLFGTLLAFGADRLTKLLLGHDGSPLLAALILGVVAIVVGRKPDRAYGTMMIPGLLQLAPGFIGTEAVMRLMRAGGGVGAEEATFFKVSLVTTQLVIGLMLAALLARRRGRGEPAVRSE
jgi:uncharacterized membrane protein YjjP (DUF1212 family)